MAYDMSKLGPAILVRLQGDSAVATPVTIYAENQVVDEKQAMLVVSPQMVFASLDEANAAVTQMLADRIARAQDYLDRVIPATTASMQSTIKQLQTQLASLPMK